MPKVPESSKVVKNSNHATCIVPIYQVTIEGYINYQEDTRCGLIHTDLYQAPEKNPAKCLQDSGKCVLLLLQNRCFKHQTKVHTERLIKRCPSSTFSHAGSVGSAKLDGATPFLFPITY